ncbi:MAG: 4-hydroxy-tetrahydrodipicolinate reductase [Ignavibacteriae bacterium]|nr:MAG: 4-hydroxy-tetrahydrodipicolinate reductase [Ignavibacteriota bacterium]
MIFMRLALVGYGKMGKEIERLALERGWSVDVRVDIDTPPVTQAQRNTIDVVIHFATANTLVNDLLPWAEAHKPIVVGTTGWQDQKQQIEKLVSTNQIGLIYSSNFSIGVNIFFRLVKIAAQMMDTFEDYDAFIQEIHHKNKIDSPSGTALTMGQIVLNHLKRKKELLNETSHGKIRPEQLHISSVRSGAVIGTHTLAFDSAVDIIELKHTAKNRSGLALGSLFAAEWIRGKKGLYTMDDAFQELFT